MSPLLDPTLCPDCRWPLDEHATCTGCGLRLTGPVADDLWRTMQRAASLVDVLRRQPVTAPLARDLPAAPPVPSRPQRPRRSLTAGSVPAVLFTVGALCLLVAAVVFVAVAWSSLGLGARTSILLGVTLGFGVAATALTRRGLRGAAETFWLVTAVLVTIDLIAAYGAGLLGFDDLPLRHAAGVGGVVLLTLGLGAARFARGTAVRTLHGMTGVATAGALVVASAEAWTLDGFEARPAATVASVLVAAGLAAFARALRMTGPAYGIGGTAALGWLTLVGDGTDRAAGIGLEAWWTQLLGWPLLVAAGIAAVVAVAGRVPEVVRMVGAGAAQVTLALTVLLPEASGDTRFVLAVAVVLALAGVAVSTPRTWSVPAALLDAAGLVPLAGLTLLRPLFAVDRLPTSAPAHGANLDLAMPAADVSLPAWTAVLGAAAVAIALLAYARWLEPGDRAVTLRSWAVVAPAVVGLGVATAVLESSPTLAVAVGAWAAVLALLGALAGSVRGAWPAPALVTAGYLVLVGFRLAVPSHLLLALLATGVTVGLAAAYRRTGAGVEIRGTLAAAAVLTAGTAASQWPSPLGGDQESAAVSLVLVAAVLGLLASLVTRHAVDRICVEVTALVAALAGCALTDDLALTSVLLTLTGTAVALTSVLHRDRDEVSWIGVLVLGGATILRIGEHLTLPELATAPAAALLLAAGVRRLRIDPSTSSHRALGSGLVLAVLPTLVLVVDEPVSPRSVVLGAVGVLLLAAGALERWSAPLLAGGGALAVLALVHLGPVAAALPRWISLGALGAALLVVAVTWEQRRQDLASAERYLDALR